MSNPQSSNIPPYPRHLATVTSYGASCPEDVPAQPELSAWLDPGTTHCIDFLVGPPETTAQCLQGISDVAGQNYASALAFSGDAFVDHGYANATADYYPVASSVREERGTPGAFSSNAMNAYTQSRSTPLSAPTQWSYDPSISTWPDTTAQPWDTIDPALLQGTISYPASPYGAPSAPSHYFYPASPSSPSNTLRSPSSFRDLSTPLSPASVASFPPTNLNDGLAWSNNVQPSAHGSLAPAIAYRQGPGYTYESTASNTRPARTPSRSTKPRKVSSRLEQFPGNTVPAPAVVNGVSKCPHCDVTDGLSRHIKQHYAHLTEVSCTGRRMPRDAPYALAHPDRCVDAGAGHVWAGGCRQRFSRQDALKRHLHNESLKNGGCLAP